MPFGWTIDVNTRLAPPITVMYLSMSVPVRGSSCCTTAMNPAGASSPPTIAPLIDVIPPRYANAR